jgi:Zn-finger in ubiquitin-hydrolases and other protein/SnoaL-like polyketide cyclase
MGAEDRLHELAQRLKDGDFESLREYLASEFFGATPEPGEPAANDRIADLALAFKAAMPDLTASLDGVTASGDGEFSATLTARGTHENDLWGAPGSGNVVEWMTPITIRSVGDRFALRIDDMPTPQRVGLLRQFRLVNPPDEMDQPPRYPVAMPEFILKLAFTGEARDRPCPHRGQIEVTEPSTDVCAQCVESGDIWPVLRMCLICGYVGCCDTSKNRHMAKHYEETGHPIFRSIHRKEGWIWCYACDAFFETRVLDEHR